MIFHPFDKKSFLSKPFFCFNDIRCIFGDFDWFRQPIFYLKEVLL